MATGTQVQTSMADYRFPAYHVPRKPLGASHAGLEFHPPGGPSALQLKEDPNASSFSHTRSRTSSSSALQPASAHPQQYGHRISPPALGGPHHHPPTRRLSSGTASTSSTGGNPATYSMATVSSDVCRSSSSRSAHTPLSYVALMRRQKGTVWCDRAQHEDPRLQAQKRAAKQRAYLELHGGAGNGRTGTLNSGKIRHQSKKEVPTYLPSSLVGATVPQRLLANEVGDDDEDDHSSEGGLIHRRTASGRSSMGSISRYPSGYQRQQGKTPPNEHGDIPELAETSLNAQEMVVVGETILKNDIVTTEKEDDDEENGFGEISDMAAPNSAVVAAAKAKRVEELRRRGSVDDRTTSMTGVKLFVANPDLSD